MSITTDEDHAGWTFGDSDSGSDEEEEWTNRPFTVDDFPRVSYDRGEQTYRIYANPDFRLRGPAPLSLFRAYNDPLVDKERDWFCEEYELHDESEITVNDVGINDCSNSCDRSVLVQFFDLKIAGYHHTQPGPAKIFGFFAARDRIKPLRNYVYKREIDNYEAVAVNRKMGTARLSLGSPARGINMTDHVLFELKLCIRIEGQPDEGPKEELLIEGCTELSNMFRPSFVETQRLYGEKCGLDLKFAVLNSAVQAKIDVEIVYAPACGLILNLYAKTSGFGDIIRLFRGRSKAGGRFSSVVGVLIDSYLDVCVEGSSREGLCQRSPQDGCGLDQKLPCYTWTGRFDACYRGTVVEKVKFDKFTTISVKVTWSMVDEEWRIRYA
ncbi:hypothetical protein ACQJBY_042597 [Aegilops geniculata]